MVLEVEKPGRLLDIRQRLGHCHLLPLEDLTGAECPLELTNESLQVVLDDAVQVYQIAVEIIQDLDPCGLLSLEVQRSAAGKHFDVALVVWEQRQQALRKTALAAHPWNDWVCHLQSFAMGFGDGAYLQLIVHS